MEQKRSHFRILYPVADRPLLQARKAEYEIIDLSEGGVRFQVAEDHDWAKVDEIVKASVVFRDGETVEITGVVLRTSPDQVVLRLKKGVPLQTIMKEQRILIQRHKYLG